MRHFFVFGGALAAPVLLLLACSRNGGAKSPDGGSSLPDGAVVIEDGAVVDQDGNVLGPDAATNPSKVNATDETTDVGGVARHYVLAVPKSYGATRSYPLIVALHGDGDNAAGFRSLLAFDDVAGDDAIVAYTDGVLDLDDPYDQNNNQQVIEAVIAAVKAKLSIDSSKIWGFGYSKGGFIANEIACRRPGVFKAMAVHASGAPQEPVGANKYPECPGVIGLPVMATEGELDTEIGGDYCASYWAMINGCGSGREPTTRAACVTFANCPADKPVVYCKAPGVSHYPPWADATQASWDFFRSL